MKSLVDFIYEWKEDLTPQIVIIMGTPGCGKTFWMQHNGVEFFKNECGITLNPMELDIDHTLKKFQLEEFPNFCDRLISYKYYTITDKKTGNSVHNNKMAWKAFIDNEQEQFEELNFKFGGNESNVPDLSKIDYNFCAPYISRYYNAKQSEKEKVLNEFIGVMKKEYFDKVFASDFSVRGKAKEEYNNDLIKKIKDITGDVFIAISGAKMNTIDKIVSLAPKSSTVRIVYLNGNVDKAVIQDAKRERSGGEKFVRDYASKIEKVWGELKNTFKDKGIKCIYEFKDSRADNLNKHPDWRLTKIYK